MIYAGSEGDEMEKKDIDSTIGAQLRNNLTEHGLNPLLRIILW